MTLRDAMLVAAGGAVGSALRYAAGSLVGPQYAASDRWPLHTFAINVAGSFLIGALAVTAARLGWPGWWRPLIAVGVLGGFTTFSAFSLEVVERLLAGQWAIGSAYALGSVVAGVAGCLLGVLAARAL